MPTSNSLKAVFGAMVLCTSGLSAAGVETIIVVETRQTQGGLAMYNELHRQISLADYCASINHSQSWCPQYQGGVGGPGQPNYGGTGQPCGNTVDAHCKCTGAASQKVYDQGNRTFHCKTPPPTAPCPRFGQTFSYDPGVWACALKPLASDPAKAAEKIKDCLRGTLVSRNWNKVPRFEDASLGYFGEVEFKPGSIGQATGVVAVRFDTSYHNSNCERCANGDATPWQEFALTEIHEFRHVDDHHAYGFGPLAP